MVVPTELGLWGLENDRARPAVGLGHLGLAAAQPCVFSKFNDSEMMRILLQVDFSRSKAEGKLFQLANKDIFGFSKSRSNLLFGLVK